MKNIWQGVGLLVGGFFIFIGTEYSHLSGEDFFSIWFGAVILLFTGFVIGYKKRQEEEIKRRQKIMKAKAV